MITTGTVARNAFFVGLAFVPWLDVVEEPARVVAPPLATPAPPPAARDERSYAAATPALLDVVDVDAALALMVSTTWPPPSSE